MTTEPIKIVVDEASLGRSDTGSITGVIFVAVGGHNFPGAGWSDFLVSILAMWLEATVSLVDGDSPVVDCLFMDGPLLITLTPMAGELPRLDCIRTNGKRQTLASAHADLSEFCSELLTASKMVEQSCTARGWGSDDMARMSQGIRSLERLLVGS